MIGWKHTLFPTTFLLGWCCGWMRREDPWIKNLDRYLTEWRPSA